MYLTSRTDVVPVPMLHNLKHNKVLHERVVLLNVATEHTPRVDATNRVECKELPDNFFALKLRYGFMEQPDIPRALMLEMLSSPLRFNMMDTSFFVGRLSVTAASKSAWRRFTTRVFEVLHRNSLPATEFFKIPAGRVVSLGSQVEID